MSTLKQPRTTNALFPAPHRRPVNQIPVGNNISERAGKFLNALPKFTPKNKVIPTIPKNHNFGICDYLSINNHGGTLEQGINAIERYGTHSGGSPLFYGVNLLTK